jgi:hypothetical protein
MKKVFASLNIAEVGLLKTLLEQEGIACTTRNQHISIALGEVPFLECMPELWVLDDQDFTKAQELISRWGKPDDRQLEPWLCPGCGEENEGQFGACWKCGYLIDEQSQ